MSDDDSDELDDQRAGIATLAGGGRRPSDRVHATAILMRERARGGEPAAHLDAARSFNQSSALLALSVLADSSIEHYRGSFANKAMVTPLITSILSLAPGLHGRADSAARTHRVTARDLSDGGMRQASRAPGSIFYNITKRPGGVELEQPVLCRADRGADGVIAVGRARCGR